MKRVFTMLLLSAVILFTGCNLPEKPKHTLTFNVTFPDYANGKAAAILFAVPYSPASDSVEGDATEAAVQAGTTDAAGSITFTFDVDEEKYWGFTIYKDLDASSTLSTGDIVWGIGGSGEFAFIYYSILFTKDITETISNWETDFPLGVHTY